jgi:bacterioferritin-associated ferredoxin
MIICLCANVSEQELRTTIADGASTVKEVGRRCGAGAGCGACKPMIRECLREAREAVQREAAMMIAEADCAFPAAPALVPA